MYTITGSWGHAAAQIYQRPIDRRIAGVSAWPTQEFLRHRRIQLTFSLHQHPYVTALSKRFIEGGIENLLSADTATPPLTRDFFDSVYMPVKALSDYPSPPDQGVFVAKPYPKYTLSFNYGTSGTVPSDAYAVYNWEIFFHAPFAIGVHLTRNQRFAEADRWLRFVFDPANASSEDAPQRYWQFAPFKTMEVEQLVTILTNLSSGENAALQTSTIRGIEAWQDKPFSPHTVARLLPSMYMEKTVMAWLDNQIAWGDYLFQQDTSESVDEALSHYILAATLLGRRPEPVPKSGSVRPQTYKDIRGELDAFSNVLRDVESDIPFDVMPPPPSSGGSSTSSSATDSLGRSLYFCIPKNDKLIGYWDTVADRLFKIRNSLNIKGIFRQLPLFDPPIDPGLLAKAAAAGIDVAGVVAGLNQPLPTVRFAFLLQKAIAACQEAKSLGGQLLSAFEKDDAEALTLMRSRHEVQMLSLGEAVKYGQAQEAGKQVEALERSLESATQRYIYFERQLGRKASDIRLPELVDLDADSLLALKLKATEPAIPQRDLDVDIAQDALALASGKLINRYEAAELTLSAEARGMQTAASVIDLIGSILGLIPQFEGDVKPIGCGAGVGFGGVQLSQLMHFMSSELKIGAELAQGDATLAAKVGAYARREQEWAYQSNNIAAEINQSYKQLRAAQIRKAVADREWSNHKQQMLNTSEIDTFLTDERNGKTANKAMYAFMKRELKGLYGQSFGFAQELAYKAQRALQHELGDPSATYLSGNYQAGMQGLLAGEKLLKELLAMEVAYQETNPPTLKPMVNVSLADLDPLALLQLRATGRCSFTIPEAYLDRTGPGEYFRRIKSVAVTVPCVVGQYAGVHCKLTSQHSVIRKSALVGGGYTRDSEDDARFEDYRGTVQSVVISSAQNDTGTVDDGDTGIRPQAFEYCGVVGQWLLELPADPSKGEPMVFDYNTISDVVLSIRYTARDGGDALKAAAKAALVAALQDANAAGAVRVFSIRNDFPDVWAEFTSAAVSAAAFAPLELALTEGHYPFWARGRLGSVTKAALLMPKRSAAVKIRATQADATKDDQTVTLFGKIDGATLEKNPMAASTGTFKWLLSDNLMSDLWLMVAWQA
jgi:hypothetical protein